jgi:hypothetical protein
MCPDVLPVLPLRHIKLREIILLDIEEDPIEDHISIEDHSPILLACPPRLVAEKSLLILILHVLIVCKVFSQGRCLHKLNIEELLVNSFDLQLISRLFVAVDSNENPYSKGSSVVVIYDYFIVEVNFFRLQFVVFSGGLPVCFAHEEVRVTIVRDQSQNNFIQEPLVGVLLGEKFIEMVGALHFNVSVVGINCHILGVESVVAHLECNSRGGARGSGWKVDTYQVVAIAGIDAHRRNMTYC